MIQLILHLIGDYVTQSDWMATNKTKRNFPALCHAVVYSLPFLLLKPSWTAFSVILGTHFLIDRFRLARFMVYGKNRLLQPRNKKELIIEHPTSGVGPWTTMLKEMRDSHNAKVLAEREKWKWSNCSATGYPSETPPFLAVWLLIAADNTLHLAINYAALAWL